MTGWEVERGKRTARRYPAITHGGSPLMPSHSQGAERRPERRAGRTGSRWLLRALVVGGLAGVAWLLTGSAAQAADRGDGPSGSLPGPVPQRAETGFEPTVGELLEAAVQPPESAPQGLRRHHVTSIPTTPEQHTAVPSPHTSGGTADDRMLPVPAGTVAERVPEPPDDPVAHHTRAVRAGVMPVRKADVQPRSRVHRHLPAARPAPEAAPDVPGDDGSVPGRANLRAVSGIPAGGPGASPEAGPSAVLPARLTNGSVDDHRLPVVAGVETRRHDAEAPTISPD
jgi:hypothetical protein